MANLVSSRLSHNFIGAVGSYGTFLEANVDMSLYNPFGNDNFAGLMQTLGKEQMVDTLKGTYWEQTRSNQPFTATGDVSGSGGATVTQTVVAADRMVIDSVTPYTASNESTLYQPQKGDILMYPNGILGIVLTNPDGSHQYTVTPYTTGELIPAVTSSDVIINLGQRSQEGSASPNASAFTPTEFEWGIGIKKSKVEFTDVAEIEPVYAANGKSWVYKNISQLINKHQKEIGVELLVGTKMTNANALAVFKEAPSFVGYIPYVETNGITINWDTVGGLTKSDFDTYVVQATNNGTFKEIGLYGSASFILEAQDLLADVSGQGASFTSFSGGEGMAVNLNHKSVTLADYTLHLKTLNEFNDPSMLGAVTAYADYALAIPMNQNSINVLCFDKEGSASKGYHERVRSGLGQNNELDTTTEEYHITSYKGLKVNGQKQHGIFKG